MGGVDTDIQGRTEFPDCTLQVRSRADNQRRESIGIKLARREFAFGKAAGEHAAEFVNCFEHFDSGCRNFG